MILFVGVFKGGVGVERVLVGSAGLILGGFWVSWLEFGLQTAVGRTWCGGGVASWSVRLFSGHRVGTSVHKGFGGLLPCVVVVSNPLVWFKKVGFQECVSRSRIF